MCALAGASAMPRSKGVCLFSKKVDNLPNRDPTSSPQTNTGLNANPALYDLLGRFYQVGFRYAFWTSRAVPMHLPGRPRPDLIDLGRVVVRAPFFALRTLLAVRGRGGRGLNDDFGDHGGQGPTRYGAEALNRPERIRSATMADVAKRAGVSRMTVSRVMNHEAKVREDTRQTVLAAIRDLNFQPNLTARNLVMDGELRIGVVYSNPSAAFMSDFLIGVFEEATSAGARLILVRGEHGNPPSAHELENMVRAGVQGVVLAPPLGESAAARDLLRAAGLPIAVVAAARPVADAINVRIDDRAASLAMTERLLALGHRRIGFITGNPDQTASAERLEGARVAIAGTPGTELVVAQGGFTYASGLAAAEALLDGGAPPTAIFASNDDMAAAAVSVAHRRHLDVPGGLTVVGFDDTTVATTLWPPLTTIRQPVRQMAAVALDRLIRAVRSDAPIAADHILDHALIERESTAPPPAAGSAF